MIRITLITLSVLLLSTAFSQKKTSFLIHPSVGYETNILRSPASSISNGQELGQRDLWKNAPYGALNFSIIRKVSEKHQYRLKSLVKRSFLSNGIGVKSNEARVRFGYQYKGRKFKNYTELGFRNLVQSGTNDFRDILGAPLTYKSMTLQSKSEIVLSKPWHLIVQPFGEIKLYERADFDQFSYHDLGIRLRGNYKYTYKGKMGFAILSEFHQRNYYISQSSNNTNPEGGDGEILEEGEEGEFDAITERARKWNYQKLGFELRFPKKRRIITTGLAYTLRTDLTEARFGYHQLEWEFGYQLKLKTTKLILKNSIIARTYPNLTEATETQGTLKYVYFKPELSLRRQLSKRVQFFLTASMKYRFSSLDDPSRQSMRSYLTTAVGAGLIFKLVRPDKPRS